LRGLTGLALGEALSRPIVRFAIGLDLRREGFLNIELIKGTTVAPAESFTRSGPVIAHEPTNCRADPKQSVAEKCRLAVRNELSTQSAAIRVAVIVVAAALAR